MFYNKNLRVEDELRNKTAFVKLAHAKHYTNYQKYVMDAFNHIESTSEYNFGNRLYEPIMEFRSYVHKRSLCNIYTAPKLPKNHTIEAVHEVISPFFLDAVQNTLAYLFSSQEKPVSISKLQLNSQEEISNDFYTELSTLLSSEMLSHATNFSTAFAQSLESYYMYGLAAFFISDFHDEKTFFCKSLDVLCIRYIKDSKNRIIGASYNTGDIIHLYIRQLKEKVYNIENCHLENLSFTDEWLEISFYNTEARDLKENQKLVISHRIVPYQPIHLLRLRPTAGEEYREGVGLSLLTEIKNYHNTYTDYVKQVAAASKTIILQNSGTEYGDNSSSITFDSTTNDSGMTVVTVTGLPRETTSLNQVMAQVPIIHNTKDQLQLLESLFTRIRENFPLISRFLNVQGQDDITATEANLRHNADLGKLRDETEYFLRNFLEQINKSQLIILQKQKRFQYFTNSTPSQALSQLNFSYDSVYKREEKNYNQQQVMSLVNMVQSVLNVKGIDMQQNNGQTSLNYDAFINEIVKLSGQEGVLKETSGLTGLKDIFSNPELAEQAAQAQLDEQQNY